MPLRVRQVVTGPIDEPGSWAPDPTPLFEALTDHQIEPTVAELTPEEIATSKRSFDLVHIHDPTGAQYRKLLPLLSKHRIPHVFSPYGAWTTADMLRRTWWRRLLDRPPATNRTCLHATGKPEADHLRRIGVRGPIEIIPVGVDAACPATAHTPPDEPGGLSLPADRRLLLYAGPIYGEPGLVPLLKACDDLETCLDGWHVVLAGTASEAWYQTFRAATRRHGKEDLVTVLRTLDRPARTALLRRADLAACPTTVDRPPIGALEALAAGLPVLTSPQSGLDDFADAGVARLCPVERGAIRDALAELLTLTPAQRATMGAAARTLVQQRYTWPTLAPSYARLYRSLVRQRK